MIKYKGKLYKNHEALAEAYGLKVGCLTSRLYNYGWSLERAIETPPGKKSDNCGMTKREVKADIEANRRRVKKQFKENASFAQCRYRINAK